MSDEPSTAPAKIVETPGTCGGRPRLDGHRLDVVWYGSIRHYHGEAAHDEIRRGWPYLRDDQLEALREFYDSHPEWHYVPNDSDH